MVAPASRPDRASDVPESHRRKERFDIDIQNAEKAMLFDDTNTRRRKLGEITDHLKGSQEDPKRVDAALAMFESILPHEQLSDLYGGFQGYLDAEAKKIGKPVEKLPRNVVKELEIAYIQRAKAGKGGTDIVLMEDQLLDLYARASEVGVSMKFLQTPFDPMLLSQDIRYRRTLRLPDGEERDKQLDKIEGDMLGLLDIAKSGGVANELRIMWAVRKMVRQLGNDHLVSIRHGLPREDMKYGTDLVLSAAQKQYAFDLKAWADDAYQREFQESKLGGAQQKAGAAGSAAFIIDPVTIREAFAELRQGEPGKASRNLMSELASNLAQRTFESKRPEEEKFLKK